MLGAHLAHDGKYRVRITVNSKTYRFGRYRTPEEAAAVDARIRPQIIAGVDPTSFPEYNPLPDNAFWLKHWHPEARYAPDSPEGEAWALENGWTAETWKTSVKRAQWQKEYDERQAMQAQQEGTQS